MSAPQFTPALEVGVREPGPTPVLLTVDDYLLLDASGALDRHGRTELIEGVILAMNAQHRPHARIKTNLGFHLRDAMQALDNGLTVLIEASLAIPPHNAPAPDILLTAEPDGAGLVPLPSVRLVVEVSDATLADDETRKARIYAAAGIPEYWIVDVRGQTIRQLWSPQADAYTQTRRVRFGDPLAAATVSGLTVSTVGL